MTTRRNPLLAVLLTPQRTLVPREAIQNKNVIDSEEEEDEENTEGNRAGGALTYDDHICRLVSRWRMAKAFWPSAAKLVCARIVVRAPCSWTKMRPLEQAG